MQARQLPISGAARLPARVPVEATQLREDRMDEAVSGWIRERLLSAFPQGTFARVEVLEYGDDPAVEPGDTAVRAFIARKSSAGRWAVSGRTPRTASSRHECARPASSRNSSSRRRSRVSPSDQRSGAPGPPHQIDIRGARRELRRALQRERRVVSVLGSAPTLLSRDTRRRTRSGHRGTVAAEPRQPPRQAE
jgi:hypothetical protein